VVIEPRTSAELRAGLQQLQELFTGKEPAEVRTGVVTVDDNRVMVPGTTAHVLPSNFVTLRSALLVPAGAAPRPLDLAGVYIIGKELFGIAPSPEWTEAQLRGLAFADVLRFVGETLAAYRRPGADEQQVDREMAERWLSGEALLRAGNLLHNPGRRLVVPQALYVLAKLAAASSPDAVPAGVEGGLPAGALFGAVEALENPSAQPRSGDVVISTTVSELSSYMIANHHLNRPLDADHLLARFVRQWVELPRERAGEGQALDLEQTFREVTGVPLRCCRWRRARRPRPTPGSGRALRVGRRC
jgi:hypothetical protein